MKTWTFREWMYSQPNPTNARCNLIRQGARFVLGLSDDATDEQIEAARTTPFNGEAYARQLRKAGCADSGPAGIDVLVMGLYAAERERDEARRLHADAVEELARVKRTTPPTAEQIELFLWREGWGVALNDAMDIGEIVPAMAKALAQHLRGVQ